MLKTINRTNSYGETLKATIDLTQVVATKELHHEVTNFYDEDGNLVKTEPKPVQYMVFIKGCEPFYVDEATHDDIVDTINKTSK